MEEVGGSSRPQESKELHYPALCTPGKRKQTQKAFTLGVNCFASTFAVGSLLKRTLTLRTITELT